ncbi:hypothetical protein Aglo03_62460 [Actinokineospora globicatena]|uniref:Uncharacterized protein n=2 Tax=Actinokineospora globicatena TaxID=103729 RepID=A0A9W6QSL1_9PSEU|nr:hypothetical protein Aglo03_62460 [Actinokineospora globicatena]
MGSWLTSRNQFRHVREQAGLAFGHSQAKDAVGAAVDLLHVLDAHRNAMWYLEHAREQGDAEGELTWRTASEATRNAVTAPHLWVRCLIPAVTRVAEEAVLATYAMEGSGVRGELSQTQCNAKDKTVAYERAVIAAVHSATVGGRPIALTVDPTADQNKIAGATS